MVTNKEKINILINKYKKYVKTILNASPDEVEKLNSLSDTEAFNYLKKLEDGEEKEENAPVLNFILIFKILFSKSIFFVTINIRKGEI